MGSKASGKVRSNRKRYLAYQAEQPFAAIFGTMLSLNNHADLTNTLCVSTSAPASVRESRKAKVERRNGNCKSKVVQKLI
jgi:hypothetical protein